MNVVSIDLVEQITENEHLEKETESLILEKERLANLVKVMADSPYQTIAEKLCQLFGRDVIINNR
jgi:hypothetical protein